MHQEMNGGTWQLLENVCIKNTFLIEETWIIYSGCICTNIDIFLSIYHRNCLEAKLYISSFTENPRRNYFLLVKIHLKSKEMPKENCPRFSLLYICKYSFTHFSPFTWHLLCSHPWYGPSFSFGEGGHEAQQVNSLSS